MRHDADYETRRVIKALYQEMAAGLEDDERRQAEEDFFFYRQYDQDAQKSPQSVLSDQDGDLYSRKHKTAHRANKGG